LSLVTAYGHRAISIPQSRLFPKIAWIINHAQDRVVMTISLLPSLEKSATNCQAWNVRRVTDNAHMPNTTLKNVSL